MGFRRSATIQSRTGTSSSIVILPVAIHPEFLVTLMITKHDITTRFQSTEKHKFQPRNLFRVAVGGPALRGAVGAFRAGGVRRAQGTVLLFPATISISDWQFLTKEGRKEGRNTHTVRVGAAAVRALMKIGRGSGTHYVVLIWRVMEAWIKKYQWARWFREEVVGLW